MRSSTPTSASHYLRMIGPGLAIAATGVGAGDLVAAAVSGSRFGFAVVWAAAVGALLKCAMNEGLARWQLATGTTLIEGWVRHLGRAVQFVFLVYLVLWSFIVGGALISACGLAAHALAPGLSVATWGLIHSVAAATLVLIGGYAPFERTIKVFIGVMFVTLIGCALFIASPVETLGKIVTESAVPARSGGFILAVIGGVGGSVTLLSYGYWIREKGWEGGRWLRTVRVDLITAYGLTGLFGVAVIVLAARVLHGGEVAVEGSAGVLRMAGMLEPVLGPVGRWTFLVGFWGAVSTSMLGVWQGVPYMFCDFVGLIRREPPERRRAIVSPRSVWYRGFLVWLGLFPLVLVVWSGRPVGLIVVYAVLSALFMPFLAGTLLYMNARKDWVGERMTSGWLSRGLLAAGLLLFLVLAVNDLLGLGDKLR